MRLYFAAVLVALSVTLCFSSETALARAASASEPDANPPHINATGWPGESGLASYYGPTQDGRRSASGLRFDQRLMTAAHPWLPFGTKVRVTLGGSERSVIVTITDRLYSHRRIIDLSAAAARELGIIRRGIAEVTLTPA